VVEERTASLIYGKKRGGAGSVEADRGTTEIEKIGRAESDVILLVAVLDRKFAGQGQQVRMSQKVGVW
jgi:hypothetical protein